MPTETKVTYTDFNRIIANWCEVAFVYEASKIITISYGESRS